MSEVSWAPIATISQHLGLLGHLLPGEAFAGFQCRGVWIARLHQEVSPVRLVHCLTIISMKLERLIDDGFARTSCSNDFLTPTKHLKPKASAHIYDHALSQDANWRGAQVGSERDGWPLSLATL